MGTTSQERAKRGTLTSSQMNLSRELLAEPVRQYSWTVNPPCNQRKGKWMGVSVVWCAELVLEGRADFLAWVFRSNVALFP